MAAVVDATVIRCPHCGAAKAERMPLDACVQRYTCTGCGRELERQPGTCCVFCSYGTVPCPPCQQERAGP